MAEAHCKQDRQIRLLHADHAGRHQHVCTVTRRAVSIPCRGCQLQCRCCCMWSLRGSGGSHQDYLHSVTCKPSKPPCLGASPPSWACDATACFQHRAQQLRWSSACIGFTLTSKNSLSGFFWFRTITCFARHCTMKSSGCQQL